MIPIGVSLAAHAAGAVLLTSAHTARPPCVALPRGSASGVSVMLVDPRIAIEAPPVTHTLPEPTLVRDDPASTPPATSPIETVAAPEPPRAAIVAPIARMPRAGIAIDRASRAAHLALESAHRSIAALRAISDRALDVVSTLPAPPDPEPVAVAPAPPRIDTSDLGARARGVADAPHPYASNRSPAYPARARRAGQAGTVIIHATIDAAGEVVGAVVLESSGFDLLDASAIDAVERWGFHPARIDGVAVEAEIDLPIRFVLRRD